MPSGIYKRTDKNLKGIRKFNNSKIGKKRPPRSEEWIANAKKARMKNPIRNWKGGVSRDPRYSSLISGRRRVSLKSNGGYHTLAQWDVILAQYNWTCPSCRKKEPEIKLTKDHIIPVIKGGSDNIENIQPLCRSCNSKKHIKIIKF